jgi:transposase-like protein
MAYPVRNQLRLFIFEKDRERVEEVMADVTVSEPERLQCPHCGSTRVQPEEANSFPEKLIHSILSGLFLNPHNKLQCQDCHRTFEPGNEN